MDIDGKVKDIPKSWDKIGEKQLRLYAQELAELYNQERGLRLELTKRAEILAKERARLKTEVTERRQAEDMFRALTNSSPIGIYLVQDRKFAFVNPKFQEQTGYSEAELLDRESLSLVIPEDRDGVRRNAVNMLKGVSSTPYEYRTVTKSGETRWNMEIVASVLYQGKLATLGSFMDVTQRKLAEAELKNRSERLAALHRVSLAMSQTLDLATISNIALETALKVLGLDAGTIRYLDESTQELVPVAYHGLPPELAQEIQARPRIKIGQGLAGKVAELSEVKVIDNLDLHKWEFYTMAAQSGFRSYVGLPLKVKDKVVGVIAAFSYRRRTFTEADIDILADLGNMVGTCMENARLFEQVEAKAREWEKTFDVMSDGIAILSPEYIILRANQALARMLNAPISALVGKPCYEVVHGTEEPIKECPLSRCMAERRACGLVKQEPHLGDRWLYFLTDPVIGPADETLGVVHVLRDISELKKAEEEIKKRNEELERRMQEMSALNALFRKHLGIRYRSENALRSMLEELTKVTEKINDLLNQTEGPAPPDIGNVS